MNVGHHLTDVATMQVPTGVSAGDPTWGAQTTVRCRVEYGTKLIIKSDGTQMESEASLVSEVNIPEGARLWLPGENTADNNAASRVIITKKAATFDGYSLYETYL